MSKRASKMGTNPLMGINGLIRDTRESATQDAQQAHDVQRAQHEQQAPKALDTQHDDIGISKGLVPLTGLGAEPQRAPKTEFETPPQREPAPMPRTQGRKGEKLPRINMAFSPERLAYLQAIAGFERVSLTSYVNALIEKDMIERKELYKTLNTLRGE